jgi:hypothetical protein
MRQTRSLLTQAVLVFGFILWFSLLAGAQAVNNPARITQPIDPEKLVTLRGNTHPLARPEYDQGIAPDSKPMERILLVLQRSPQQEAALRNLLDEQQIKSSPNFHMWLTPEQFGEQFGPADIDIQAVTDWLTSQGFQINKVAAGRTVIEFSGTAGQVRQAFHTEMHRYVVNGQEHWANASDPQIPAALAPVVAGFASLNNFPRKARIRQLGTFSREKATGLLKPLFTFPYESGYLLAVGPADFATIYNVTPLWNASIDGTGQTIAVVEDSNINPQDATDFRSMFGLPTNNPKIVLNGPDPGIIPCAIGGDECEADLDAEWAGAVAKGATVDVVVSEDTEVTAGVDLSALYIIDNNTASVMSSSYGLCEAYTGASGIQFYNVLWEQGAAQGITILIANGDSGSAGCDDPDTENAAENGLAVSGNATTPFNIAVGGLDFNEGNLSSGTWETYWNYSSTGSVYPSAKSYIPEMTWNDSCASTGSLTGCEAGTDVDIVGGSGGPSNCANPEIVEEFGEETITCNATGTGITGIPKPSWQTGPGVPSDQVRDTPDVSLFAGDGMNGSFYIYCNMDANASSGGSSTSCDLNSPYTDFQGAGGTSFAAPAFAGIIAMVNQKTGERQGNANYVLYPMAAKSGNSCPSVAYMASTANSSSCIFYDTQYGNDSVACLPGSLSCSDQLYDYYGILVNPANTAQAAWTTTAGYDLATGLGSVNAANLVNQWSSYVGTFAPTTTTLSITPTSITHGQSVNVTVTVTSKSGTPTGDVGLVGGPNSSNLGISYVTLGAGGTITEPTILLPGGTYNVTAQYAGDGVRGASSSSPVQVTVSPESSKTFVQVVSLGCSDGYPVVTGYDVTSVTYGSNFSCSGALVPGYMLRMDVTNSSGSLTAAGVSGTCYGSTGIPAYACPTGQVTVTGAALADVGAPSDYTPGTYTLNSQGYAEDQFIQLPGGSDALSAAYVPYPIPPNNSYSSSTGTATISVAQAATATYLSSSAQSVNYGSSVTLTANVNTFSIGLAPSGTVTFLNGGVAMSGTVTYTPANASSVGYATLTATFTTPALTSTGTFTAQYSGDGNYTGSTSSGVTVGVVGTKPPSGWQLEPGALSQVSVGSDGTVWGINSAGQAYMFNPQTQTWQQAPGLFTQIAVGASGFVWALNAAGQIYRYDPATQGWDQIPGALSQIAVGSDGDVWGINASSQIYHLNSATHTWTHIPGALAQIAVGYDGAIWGINAAQQIYRFNPGTQTWQQMPGALKQVAVGADGDVWGINNAGQIYHFNTLTQRWNNTPGSLAQIAVGSGSNVWGIDATGAIWCFNAQAQAWNQIPGQLAQIAVGADGAVWGVNSANQIYQFVQPTQPTQTFHQAPGLFAQIAAGIDGEVWAIDATQEVWRYYAQLESFELIPGTLTQICVGFGGNVWGLDAAGQVWQLNPSTQGWEQIPGSLAQLEVGADGSVWGIDSADRIWRFSASTQAFEQIPGSLAQLAVGADGTVWGINSVGQIYRFNPATQGWVQIPGSLAQIAVGSANNVWGLNAAGQIWRYDPELQTWDSIPGALTSIAVAFDGTVWGLNSANQIWRYKAQTQSWDSIPGLLSQVSVGADAVVWGLNASGQAYQYW